MYIIEGIDNDRLVRQGCTDERHKMWA